jgi:hypothetical protein
MNALELTHDEYNHLPGVTQIKEIKLGALMN